MSTSFTTLATGVVGISIVHSMVPHHWLPFIIVGRSQSWTSKKTLSLLGLGALVHTISTITVGLLVGYLGHQLDQRFEAYHGIIPGIILFAFGSGYFLSGFQHHHHEVANKVAASSLILMLGLSPCLVVAPVFVLIGPIGFFPILKLCLLMSLLTVVGMVVLGWLAMKGLNSFKLEWLEKNEPRIMGSLLMLLGVSFIIL